MLAPSTANNVYNFSQFHPEVDLSLCLLYLPCYSKNALTGDMVKHLLRGVNGRAEKSAGAANFKDGWSSIRVVTMDVGLSTWCLLMDLTACLPVIAATVTRYCVLHLLWIPYSCLTMVAWVEWVTKKVRWHYEYELLAAHAHDGGETLSLLPTHVCVIHLLWIQLFNNSYGGLRCDENWDA